MICFKCGKPYMEFHHVLFSNKKGKRASSEMKAFVNHEFNLQPLCRDCHLNHQGFSNREAWMKYLISEYGRSEVISWLETAPDKMKITDLWKSNRLLADFENVAKSWRPENTGGLE